MAVADPGEDTVALAATAARRLLSQHKIDPRRIGMLVVGTETGVDHSKPVASHVQGLLGLPRDMRVYDTQHACYGGTAALMAACEWIASGAGAGRAAIVICSDIARYGKGTAGEPTQGGGAVAILVSETPRILSIDLGASGTSSVDVYDFWRPLGRREALVDGHYSISCYLQALSGAYRAFRQRAGARGILRPSNGHLPSEDLARILYHVPFCKMARKAHAQVRRCDIEDRLSAIGGSFDTAAEAAEAKAAAASFEKQVATSLGLCAEIGNCYTASLYLGLAGLLESEGSKLAGQRIGLFSYGSGCCAEFFTGVVGEGAARAIAEAKIQKMLDERERLDVAEYERILEMPADAPPAEEPAPGAFRFTGTLENRRTYRKGAEPFEAATRAEHATLAAR
jgi:hydroxymethylglutaryl-CoA synthase